MFHKLKREVRVHEYNCCTFILQDYGDKSEITIFPFGAPKGTTYSVSEKCDFEEMCRQLYEKLVKTKRMFK